MTTWPRWAWIAFGAGSVLLIALGIFATTRGGRRALRGSPAPRGKIVIEASEVTPSILDSARAALSSRKLTFCPVGSADAVDAERADRMFREIANNSGGAIVMMYDPDDEDA